jgi:hypothetical protein
LLHPAADPVLLIGPSGHRFIENHRR